MPSLSFFDSTLAGAACYPVLRYLGQYLNAGAYEAFSAAHWTGYAAAGTVTADGGGGFSCPVPTGTGNGPVVVVWYQRAGGSPAATDSPVYEETYQVPVSVDSSGRVTLAPAGLDAIAVTDPGGISGHTTFPKILVALYRRFYRKATVTASQLKTYADDGTTVNTTQTLADDGTTQTQGAAT